MGVSFARTGVMGQLTAVNLARSETSFVVSSLTGAKCGAVVAVHPPREAL